MAFGVVAVTALEYGPEPKTFFACTRKLYVTPALGPTSVNDVDVFTPSAAVVHVDVVDRLYWMT